MTLRSKLFSGDAKLDAAATSDPAHVTRNAVGLHVAKIQVALLVLDGATIDDGELQRFLYGRSTANAVLAYKRKRKIINFRYQTQADDIVGRMTIATLDREMLEQERRSQPTRIEPLFATRRESAPQSARATIAPLAAAGIGATGGFSLVGNQNFVLQVFNTSFMQVSVGDTGSFTVLHGIGRTVVCTDDDIAFISDPGKPQLRDRVLPVSRDPHLFNVKGVLPGKTAVIASNRFGAGFGAQLDVTVAPPAREVTVAFHFLGGQGFATQRDRNSLAAAVALMNSIYEDNVTNITFRVAVVDPSPIIVPEFASKTGLLTFAQRQRTPDWNAITKNRSASGKFNVFFVRDFQIQDAPFGGAVALTDTPGKAGFLARDCIIRDDLKGVELGLVLAHEAGHGLGEDGNAVAGDLMNDSAPGKTIAPPARLRMNTNAGTP